MTYYDILSITPAASAEDVRIAYLAQAKRFHPDNQQTGNEEKFKATQEAYDVLSDHDKRARYDFAISQPHERPPAPRPVAEPFDWDAPESNGMPLHEVLASIVDSIAGTYVGGNPLLRAAYRGIRPKVKNELKRVFRDEERVRRRKAAAR